MSNRSAHPPVLSWLLGIMFLAALLMGAGPGTMLIDQTKFWFGLPRLYVWALGWCAVEITIVLIANWLIWSRDRSHDEKPASGDLSP